MFKKITSILKIGKYQNIMFTTLLASTAAYAQVGVGTTTPDNSAALEISSTSKGFLPPRLTEAQIDALLLNNPAEGLIVYCTDCSTKGIYFFNGATFENLATGTTTVSITTVTGSGGATWIDRNLGATQVATSSTDANAYGDLYQWGRNSDGHQLRNSATSAGPVASGNEGTNFITIPSGSGWLTVADNTRWNGASKGTHDPCPMDYRVPTLAEWTTERNAWPSQDIAGSFASPLKLTIAGRRNRLSGNLSSVGVSGQYWTSESTNGVGSILNISTFGATLTSGGNAQGYSVRCIAE